MCACVTAMVTGFKMSRADVLFCNTAAFLIGSILPLYSLFLDLVVTSKPRRREKRRRSLFTMTSTSFPFLFSIWLAGREASERERERGEEKKKMK